MREIRLSKVSSKFLQKLGSNKFTKQIVIKIKQLAVNGHLHDCKLLKGNLSGYYRMDVGEFRVIYLLEQKQLIIPMIGKRNDGEVYKLMEKKI